MDMIMCKSYSSSTSIGRVTINSSFALSNLAVPFSWSTGMGKYVESRLSRHVVPYESRYAVLDMVRCLGKAKLLLPYAVTYMLSNHLQHRGLCLDFALCDVKVQVPQRTPRKADLHH